MSLVAQRSPGRHEQFSLGRTHREHLAFGCIPDCNTSHKAQNIVSFCLAPSLLNPYYPTWFYVNSRPCHQRSPVMPVRHVIRRFATLSAAVALTGTVTALALASPAFATGPAAGSEVPGS